MFIIIYPSSKVVPVDCSPDACNANFDNKPGDNVSSGLNDKLKSVENGSGSLLEPVFNPLQLGRTHVIVVHDRSNLKYKSTPRIPGDADGPSVPSHITAVQPWCNIFQLTKVKEKEQKREREKKKQLKTT